MYRMILASQSPRRLQLLQSAGFEVTAFPVKVSETIDKNLTMSAAIREIAAQKARAFVEAHKELKGQKILVVGGDTLVVYGGQALGKPTSAADAQRTLRLLSGQVHEVITGFCLIDLFSPREISATCTTLIQFRALSDREISEYVATGDPMDKAGSYGIQGEAKKFVESINGSWSNVVGFPMELFEQTLKEKQIVVARKS